VATGSLSVALAAMQERGDAVEMEAAEAFMAMVWLPVALGGMLEALAFGDPRQNRDMRLRNARLGFR
jgi:hypothetical protein